MPDVLAGAAEIEDEAETALLDVCGLSRDETLAWLRANSVPDGASGIDMSLLSGRLDAELADALVTCCGALSDGARLRLAHHDLSSGTDAEQRHFDLGAERKVRVAEKSAEESKRSLSSKEKDFAVAAAKKRKAQEALDRIAERTSEIDQQLGELEAIRVSAPWHILFHRMQTAPLNRLGHLDFSDCCLHATGISQLANLMLELEARADGTKIKRLNLDGNDLGDIGMAPLALLLRLTVKLEALQLQNVGITDVGLSELLAGLVTNGSLLLLDVRRNGLCTAEAGGAAIAGVGRFNPRVQVLFP